MYRRVISFLLVFIVVLSFSFSAFAQSSNEHDIILEKGEILTWEDFTSIKVEMDNAKKPMTDEEVRKLIVKKIKEKEKMIDSSSVTASYTIWGMNLNSTELVLVYLYPVQAVFVYADAQTALTQAQNRYQSSTLSQGNGDAFRHTYWNALMTYHIGAVYAAMFASAHEAETPDGVDKTMDLSNNETGRYIGANSNPPYESTVMNYVSWGWLYRIVNGQLVATDSSGRL